MKITNEQLKLAADTIRCLCADMVEKANSGHPGAAMAKAPAKAFELGDHSTLSVSVKFGASGTATAKCLGRSCSAALVPDAYDSSFYSAYFYFPPKAGEDLGFAVWAELEWDGKEFK